MRSENSVGWLPKTQAQQRGTATVQQIPSQMVTDDADYDVRAE